MDRKKYRKEIEGAHRKKLGEIADHLPLPSVLRLDADPTDMLNREGKNEG
jgi:hypothetical protein